MGMEKRDIAKNIEELIARTLDELPVLVIEGVSFVSEGDAKTVLGDEKRNFRQAANYLGCKTFKVKGKPRYIEKEVIEQLLKRKFRLIPKLVKNNKNV